MNAHAPSLGLLVLTYNFFYIFFHVSLLWALELQDKILFYFFPGFSVIRHRRLVVRILNNDRDRYYYWLVLILKTVIELLK